MDVGGNVKLVGVGLVRAQPWQQSSMAPPFERWLAATGVHGGGRQAVKVVQGWCQARGDRLATAGVVRGYISSGDGLGIKNKRGKTREW